jgi:hypothetical protein
VAAGNLFQITPLPLAIRRLLATKRKLFGDKLGPLSKARRGFACRFVKA